MKIPYFYILEHCYYNNELDSIICRLCDNDEIFENCRKNRKLNYEKLIKEHLIDNHLSELVEKQI